VSKIFDEIIKCPGVIIEGLKDKVFTHAADVVMRNVFALHGYNSPISAVEKRSAEASAINVRQ
jgi:hypothetical protein